MFATNVKNKKPNEDHYRSSLFDDEIISSHSAFAQQELASQPLHKNNYFTSCPLEFDFHGFDRQELAAKLPTCLSSFLSSNCQSAIFITGKVNQDKKN
ncbi:Uncharacterised protein [Mesomycoplasma conjunctivae]|uniref:Uncharacterized protein n=1 Tax=Mesomycoplasma conjunctivae (strain ATCC 25834 / NCTC 10147 / HRC/581) TaxID=572263 RepID=C5J6J3_MESCH|nr:hypothetical protein [Mesomycoplasma conjunctivae]CAT05086.1 HYPOTHETICAL PROTEIN MCJ_003980 [Mesomycoplasma conjunctivae]VEU66257.1 Uncharacterised protein [Mesomycoplasma conjunctivae]